MVSGGPHFGRAGGVQMVRMSILESAPMDSWEPVVDGTVDVRMAHMGPWLGA